MKLVLEEAKDFGVLPEDTIITVEVEGIEPKEVPGRDGREGWTKLDFKFIIRDLPSALFLQDAYRELMGTRIWGSVGMRFTEHPDNKLRQWAEALLDMGDLGAGFELDTDMLLGRKARAVIAQYPKRTGGFGHQVGGLLPAAPMNQVPVTLGAGPASVVGGVLPPTVPWVAPTPAPAADLVSAIGWDDDAPPF